MSLKDYLLILRPGNCIMAAIATYIGFAVASMGFEWNPMVAVAMLVAFVVCGGGQAINDYFDREIDAKIRPSKAIPAGRVNAKSILAYSLVLFVAGIALAHFFLNFTAFLIALGFSILLIVYSSLLHNSKYLGNWIVAAGTAFTLIFGASLVGNFVVVQWLALSALLTNAAREITKDLEDLEADRGKKLSLPMIFSLPGVKAAVFILYLVGILVAVWLYVSYLVASLGFLLLVVVAGIIFMISWYKLLHNKYSISSKISKWGMLVALLSYVAILVW